MALDSNVAIALLNGRPGSDHWIRRFTEVFLPVPTLGELRYGALKSARPEKNMERVEILVQSCQVLGVRAATTESYARLRLTLREKGRPIPENDLWIAAICVERELPLATFDRHFHELDALSFLTPP